MTQIESYSYFSVTPLAVKLLAIATTLIGLTITIAGGAILTKYIEFEEYNPPILGEVFGTLGFVMIIAGIGLYRLNPYSWLLFIGAALLLMASSFYMHVDDLPLKAATVVTGFILGSLIAENEFFLRSEVSLREMEMAGINTKRAPYLIKIHAILIMLAGIATGVLGTLVYLWNEEEAIIKIENYDPEDAASVLIFIGVILLFLGYGLWQLKKEVWVITIFTSLILIAGLVVVNLDDALPKLLMASVACILGDLTSENEFFLKQFEFTYLKKLRSSIKIILVSTNLLTKLIFSITALGIGLAWLSLFNQEGFGDDEWTDIVVVTIAALSLLATITILNKAIIASPENKSRRTYWGLFLAWFCYFVGEAIYAAYWLHLMEEPPYPGIGDLFWAIGTAIMVSELLIFADSIKATINKKLMYFFFTIVGILVIMLLYLAFWDILLSEFDAEYGPYQKSLDIFYFTADVLIIYTVGFIMLKMTRARKRLPLGWIFLIIGMVCMIIADTQYAYKVWKIKPIDWETYSLEDVFFVFQYVFWTLGAAFFPIKPISAQITEGE
ncbi:MAG: hypothetical protein ACFFDT_31655 [Candidatus Hodarchaeota archaeon]